MPERDETEDQTTDATPEEASASGSTPAKAAVTGADVAPMRFAREIFETPVESEIADSFLAYSLSVITSRAIPDVRDGLKPVQRRILYSMDEQSIRPSSPYKKCARVVGDCFAAGTLIQTERGLAPIETVEVGDRVVTGQGTLATVVEAYANPVGPMVAVTLADGRVIECTPDQRFRVLRDDLEFEWVPALQLTGRAVLSAAAAGELTTVFEGPRTTPHRTVVVSSVTPIDDAPNFDVQVDDPDHSLIIEGVVAANCMGKYHPHGDSAIYEALVRMAQPFSLRVPLVDGHGNFGSPDDPPAASRYCVTGDTRVRMADGRTPRIDELAEIASDSTVELGVEVLGLHGEAVLATHLHHSGLHPVRRIRTAGGFELAATENHPVLVLTGDEEHFGVAWKLMAEIVPGDVVVLDRTSVSEVPRLAPSDPEWQLGVLAGGMVSEGWHTERRVGFNNTDHEFFEYVLDAYDALVGGPRYVYERTLPSGKRIRELDVQRFEHWANGPLSTETGRRSVTKRIPTAVWQGSQLTKRAFLQAAFEGDGTVHVLPNASLTVLYYTISEQLAHELQLLLLEFGILARVGHDPGRGAYLVRCSNQRDVRLFAERVGFLTAKQVQLDTAIAALPERVDAGGTRGRLSSDHVPYLREFVLAQHRRDDRVRGEPGREWLTKHNFDRRERFERHAEEIRAHLSVPEARAAFEMAFRDGWAFQEIISVTDEGLEPVYSLRVATEEHAFITNGFVSHNTECRMDHAAVEMVGELREQTVSMRPNYDGTETEPEVLPARIPNLLVNGTTGIAVGMATNCPPHNIAEVVAAAAYVLEHPEATSVELMRFVPGPDFPTGGVIVDAGGIKEAYETGRGAFKIRAKAQVGQVTPKRRGITITELPYTIGPERFIAKCKELINARQLEGIADLKDLSDRKRGLYIVVECKTGVNPQAVLAELYAKTPLETSFSVNAVALVNGKPETLSLARMLSLYLEHRLEVVTKRTEFRLRKAEERAHIVEGLVTALASIDEVVELLKRSRDPETAKAKLIKTFSLSEIQAGHILEMPLRRLTGLEITKLKDELKELKALIKDFKDILAKPARRRAIVGDELTEIAARYGDDRRTRIIGIDQAEMPQQALEIPDEPCEVCISANGLVFKPAKRRSKPAKHDVLIGRVATTTRSQLRVLTDLGRLLTLDAVEVPESSSKLAGVPIGDLVELDRGEQVVAAFGELAEGETLLLATAGGVVKRLTPDQFSNRSVQLVGLKDADRVVGAVVVNDADEFVLVTSDAQLLRAKTAQVRPQGRSAGGVAGIKLGEGARVLTVGRAEGELWTVTDKGGAKRTPISEYPTKGRATGGVRCMRLRAGERELAGALVGEGAVHGVTARGVPVALELDAAKRDATGEPVAELAGFGWV